MRIIRAASIALAMFLSHLVMTVSAVHAQTTGVGIEYRVIATNKTSTMEKELNEAAEAGFRFEAVMGGETAFGGNEVVVVTSRNANARGTYAYKLLATSKTSTATVASWSRTRSKLVVSEKGLGTLGARTPRAEGACVTPVTTHPSALTCWA